MVSSSRGWRRPRRGARATGRTSSARRPTGRGRRSRGSWGACCARRVPASGGSSAGPIRTGTCAEIDLQALAADVIAYFDRLLGPHWARIEAAFEAEFSLRRAQAGAPGGGGRVRGPAPGRGVRGRRAADRPRVRPGDRAGRPRAAARSVGLRGARGVGDDRRAWQPSVIYAPRGIGNLWAPPEREREAALAGLLGGRRAEVLAGLATPVSTLASRRLRASPAGVSAHLRAARGRARDGAAGGPGRCCTPARRWATPCCGPRGRGSLHPRLQVGDDARVDRVRHRRLAVQTSAPAASAGRGRAAELDGDHRVRRPCAMATG